jgi:hypothetical protein
MKIKQYNFINGMSGSGKTLLTIKLVSVLNRKVIYFDTDLGSNSFRNMCGRLGLSFKPDRFVFFSGKSDFESVQNTIRKLNEDCYESWDIVVDSVDRLSGSFSVFLSSLPTNHRYFFTSTIRLDEPIYAVDLMNRFTKERSDKVLTDYQDRYLIPPGSVSVFRSFKGSSENLSESLCLYNYNTGEEYNWGSMVQIFRNEKIKSILNETENQNS